MQTKRRAQRVPVGDGERVGRLRAVGGRQRLRRQAQAVRQRGVDAVEGGLGHALVARVQVAAVRVQRAALQLAELHLGALLALVAAQARAPDTRIPTLIEDNVRK